MNQRAVYFDLDGTLADTRADIAATVNHTRRELGLAEKSVEEIISYVGNGARKLLERSIPEWAGGGHEAWSIPERAGAGLLEIFLSHYNEHATETVELYPGVEETLAELKRRGWLLGINTAKPRGAVDLIVRKFALDRFFGEAVIAGGDSAEMKPSARPLHDCAAKLGHVTTPADWMVGDNWTDVDCAANAGVGSVYCDFGFGILRSSVPTARIRSFGELLEVLG